MQAHSTDPAEETPDLRIAPEPAETDPETDVYAAIAEHLEARTMVVAKPENHLVAALLNASTEQAAEVLAIVADTDIEGYLASVVIRIIRQLVDTGAEPTPQAVVARARGPLELDGIGMYSTRPSLQRLVLYVSEVYTMGMPVRPWADAFQVVEDSYRRSFEEVGRRMAQMAEACADVEDLEEMTGNAVRQWRADWHRLRRLRALAYPAPAKQPPDTEPDAEPPPEHE
ncbi:hypothetical protein [Nocardia amamiensis]|uniref:hypothetical protein n=1 Tax=Nocardia amamiensis TaxID=404578 RepID=UPI000831B726|nr:hypothetical protein [Nocardia amamiensis]